MTIQDLLHSARMGEPGAEERLFDVVYSELRIIAHRTLHPERGNLTLSTTALVNEAYLKLAQGGRKPYEGQRYFFGAASRAMLQIVVDLARRRSTRKRGDGFRRVDVEMDELPLDECAEEIVSLDAALVELSEIDSRLSEIVECRFFGGLTDEQTSIALGVSDRTVRRGWRKARAWLYQRLNQEPGAEPVA